MEHTSAHGGLRKLTFFRPWMFSALVLTIYTVVMIAIDASQTRDFVRIFFTDIGMPYKEGAFARADGHIGYGLNTSLSCFFFSSAGVVMMFAALAGRSPFDQGDLLFLLQGSIFIYLAADDRFLIHERVGRQLGIYSSLVVFFAIVINATIYALYARLGYFNQAMILRLAVAGSIAVLATGVDFFMPLDFPVRLSVEDLLKVWAAFCFLLFAWETARFRVIGRFCGERSFTLPDQILRRTPQWLRGCLTS